MKHSRNQNPRITAKQPDPRDNLKINPVRNGLTKCLRRKPTLGKSPGPYCYGPLSHTTINGSIQCPTKEHAGAPPFQALCHSERLHPLFATLPAHCTPHYNFTTALALTIVLALCLLSLVIVI